MKLYMSVTYYNVKQKAAVCGIWYSDTSHLKISHPDNSCHVIFFLAKCVCLHLLVFDHDCAD